MNIKKPFQEIVDLLEANKGEIVETILEDIIAIAMSKKQDSTVRRNEKDEVTHIFCWYHKEWEPVEWYGLKASSHSGYNTFCKQGVNSWTKQQRDFKKLKGELLEKLMEGEIEKDDLQEEIARLEADRDLIKPRS